MPTAREIIRLEIRDPELFSLIGLLEGGIGADRISDMTTYAIRRALLECSEHQYDTWKLPVHSFQYGKSNYQLIRNPFSKEPLAILLVPRDVPRELPLAHSWSEIADAANKNEQLRRRVNDFIGDIWAARTRQNKQQLRERVLRSRKAFDTLMDALGLRNRVPYDPAYDGDGHYLWRRILSELGDTNPVHIDKPVQEDINELERVVDAIIAAFKTLIEDKGQWYHLWHNGKRRATSSRVRSAERSCSALAQPALCGRLSSFTHALLAVGSAPPRRSKSKISHVDIR